MQLLVQALWLALQATAARRQEGRRAGVCVKGHSWCIEVFLADPLLAMAGSPVPHA